MPRWRLRRDPRFRRKGGWVGRTGRCPRHHTSACIPSEPPSLAHHMRRAAAAEKGGPSLWWARASGLASRTFDHFGDLFRFSQGPSPRRGHDEVEHFAGESNLADDGPIDGSERFPPIGTERNEYLHPERQVVGEGEPPRPQSVMSVESAQTQLDPRKGGSGRADRPKENPHDASTEIEAKAIQLSLDLSPLRARSDDRSAGVVGVEVDGDSENEASRTIASSAGVRNALGKEAHSVQPSEDQFRMALAILCHHEGRSCLAWVCSKYGSKIRLRGQATAPGEDWTSDAVETRQAAGLSGRSLGSCHGCCRTPNSTLQTGAEGRGASSQAKTRVASLRQSRARSGQGLLLLSSAARDGGSVSCGSPTRYASGYRVLAGVPAPARRWGTSRSASNGCGSCRRLS